MIQLQNVSKKYPSGTVAFENLNIEIGKGEFVFLVGPSGSGKSTVTKLLLREETVTSGQITVNDFKLNKLPQSKIPFLRRKMGVVFQDFRLLQNKTVYENVAFTLQIVGALPKDIRRKVPNALGLVDLCKKAKLYPRELSGGEQQRVALARAIVNNPLLLIADEPTGNLDPKTSWEIMQLLNDINQRGTTVIVATHEIGIVREMNKRIINMSEYQTIPQYMKDFEVKKTDESNI